MYWQRQTERHRSDGQLFTSTFSGRAGIPTRSTCRVSISCVGALFTVSEERADLYRSLRTHGEGKTRSEVLRTGMNGRLDSIQAAVLKDSAERERVQAALKADGVPTAIYYPRPLHLQPAYAAAHDGAVLPVSEDLATRIMALPIHPDLTDVDVDRICDAVVAAV